MNDLLLKDAVLRVGEVSGIEGRKIYITLDKDKNASELLYDGKILKNISVGSYIEIRKGFLSIIGKAEGEKLIDDSSSNKDKNNHYLKLDKNQRTLTLSLSGYLNTNNQFVGGIKELPLIGNEAFILTEDKIHEIHNLLKEDTTLKINIAKTEIEEVRISFPIDGLFNSHIAIFGNTGSGKSNTLASLYQEMIRALSEKSSFENNSRILIFDFNGEYTNTNCITSKKKVYHLSTQKYSLMSSRDKIPLSFDELMDIETLSIFLEATDKTQKPFLKRTLSYYNRVKNKTPNNGEKSENDFYHHFKNILKKDIKIALQMSNKDTAYKILDYLELIISSFCDEETEEKLRDDIEYHNTANGFFKRGNSHIFFASNEEEIKNTNLYKAVDDINFEDFRKLTELEEFYIFLHIQLINDLYRYKVQLNHVLPVINRFKAKKNSINNIFEVSSQSNIWANGNVVVISLHNVNLDMRKTVPLLVAKNIYNKHKNEHNKKSLSIIIDEAHNILSKTSFRETEDWKDYRLETFEEIIKEGRKFGVFVTIASQRPNDISETIISQAHNYFIHQLINQRDLQTIGNAVSYIDKVTEESIPTLPIGTCIFSGTATPMPLKLMIDELDDEQKPNSHTLQFEGL
ncbi:MAG: ATP-binding protein [Candidatus Celaenobacter polaris]|nr:ATP-binding protein [Candidatus Celaenobacter polaris]